MNRTRGMRFFWLIVGVIVLAGVGLAAYNLGLGASNGGVHPMFGMGRGYNGGFGGFGGFGLLGALLFGFLLVWLFASILSGYSSGSGRTTADPAGVDRLRELTELHDRGALTDEEFTAAKRKLLGI